MSESKKKKAAVTEEVNLDSLTLSHLMLDCPKDKYRLVIPAIRWAQEIKKRDQSNEPADELLNKALREILTHKVSLEEIEKLPPLPKVEKRHAESAAKSNGKSEGDEKKDG